MKLLDGSLSVSGQQRTAEMADIFTNFEMVEELSSVENNIHVTTIGQAGMFYVNYNTTNARAANGSTITLRMAVNGQQVTASVQNDSGSVKTGNDIVAMFAGAEFTGGGKSYTATYNAGSPDQLQFDAAAKQYGRIDSVSGVSFSISDTPQTEALGATGQGVAGTGAQQLVWTLDPVAFTNFEDVLDVGDIAADDDSSFSVQGIRIDMRINGVRVFFDAPSSKGSNSSPDSWFSAFAGGVQGNNTSGVNTYHMN